MFHPFSSHLNSEMPNTKKVSDIATGSTKNLAELGIITQTGQYRIDLVTNGITAPGAFSSYFVYYNDVNTFYVTPIFEGDHNAAARIDSNGILTRVGGTASSTMIARIEMFK